MRASNVWADEGDQCVGGLTDEGDIYCSADGENSLGKSAGERFGLAVLRIDPGDLAECTLCDVEPPVGTNGGAHCALETRGEQLTRGRCGWRSGARGPR